MEDLWAYRRRRIAVFVVAIVAAAATIATSPSNPQGHVDGSTPAKVVLTDDAPRAAARFVLTLSDSTLPRVTGAATLPSGTVSFVVADASGSGAGGDGPVQITASAVGVTTPAGSDPTGPSWPIDQLCRVAEPCRREFDVSVEWLRPTPNGSITVPVTAKVALLYDRWESPPPGATATWEAGEFTAVAPPPTVPASLDLGRTTLGRDSPLAARHVVLRGSAALLADPTTPDITAYVRSELPESQRPHAILTMVSDDATDPTPVDAGAFIEPFTGCPRAEDCARGFTIVARWVGTDPAETIDVDWSFDAVARFVGSAVVPADATLAAEIDKRIDLGLASPRLQGHAAGTFDLVSGGGRKAGNVRLTITPPQLGDVYLGAIPPAVALVRIRAAVKDPGAAADLVAWLSTPNVPGVGALSVPDDGSELQAIALPLGRCFNPPPCTGSIEITVESRADKDATITWDVAVELPLPAQASAAGQLKVEVARAP
jgi:hypothetical protein